LIGNTKNKQDELFRKVNSFLADLIEHRNSCKCSTCCLKSLLDKKNWTCSDASPNDTTVSYDNQPRFPTKEGSNRQ